MSHTGAKTRYCPHNCVLDTHPGLPYTANVSSFLDRITVNLEELGVMPSNVLRRASICLLLLISHASAQSSGGTVNGTVKDATGGAIAGASIKLTNQNTQIVQQGQSNANGYYVFVDVRPGSYSLSVEAPGFKTARVPDFELSVNQTLTQNLSLDIGSLSESVVVEATAPLLQQSSSELGTVIDAHAVAELPLNGRNFTQLMILTPAPIRCRRLKARP